MTRLEGKVTVITGAGRGLGAAMAAAFAREGAVVVVQERDEANGHAVAETLRRAGAVTMAWICDVADEDAIHQLYAEVLGRFGKVDVLVNNAGVDHTLGDGSPQLNGMEQLASMSRDAFTTMAETNVTGAFLCTRELARCALEAGRGASIICISSIAGTAGLGPIHYAASKGALLGFVRSIAFWGGPHGIRANVIAPGVIATPMTDAEPEVQDFVRSRTPLGRIGAPDDIAHLAVYLASDESSFMTGQTLSPNGGIVTT